MSRIKEKAGATTASALAFDGPREGTKNRCKTDTNFSFLKNTPQNTPINFLLGVFEGRRLSPSPHQFNAILHIMAGVIPCRPLTLRPLPSIAHQPPGTHRHQCRITRRPRRHLLRHADVQTVRPWIHGPSVNRYIKNASQLSSREAPLFYPLHPRSLSFFRFIRFIGLKACGTGLSRKRAIFRPVYQVTRLCHSRLHDSPHGFFAHFTNRTL